MARTTAGAMLRSCIYGFVYGDGGVGKTRLIMSLSKNNGLDVGIVTAESSGVTSLVTAGYDKNIPVELVGEAKDEDPFEPAIAAVKSFRKDPAIKNILVDGLTVLCGRAVDYYSDGEGEKALGWDGWGQVLNGFRLLEKEMDFANRAGKSVLMTAWENPPQYEDTLGGKDLKAEGRPLLQGKAQVWMPGNVDFVGRMTSRFVTGKDAKGKATKVFEARLQVHRGNDWYAKTRFTLPHNCPADLKQILAIVNGQAKAARE